MKEVRLQMLYNSIVNPFTFQFFLNVHFYFWEERQSVSRERADREREREGDTQSEAGSSLRAVSTEPDAGLQLMNCEIMTWAEVGRFTEWATQVPQ